MSNIYDHDDGEVQEGNSDTSVQLCLNWIQDMSLKNF